MKIEFSFDQSAIEKQGYTLNDVYNTIKKHFADKGLPCIADQEVLAFEDNGGRDDFSNIWAITSRLFKSKWFLPFATSCQWYEDEAAPAEDVLSQAWKLCDRKVV